MPNARGMTVAAWPQSHYGYRQDDIREIVSVLDQAISSLRAVGGGNPFELSLVAMASPPELEPVLGMPNVREQLDQMLRLASITTSAVGTDGAAAGRRWRWWPKLVQGCRRQRHRTIAMMSSARSGTSWPSTSDTRICRAVCSIRRLVPPNALTVRRSSALPPACARRTRSSGRSVRRSSRR